MRSDVFHPIETNPKSVKFCVACFANLAKGLKLCMQCFASVTKSVKHSVRCFAKCEDNMTRYVPCCKNVGKCDLLRSMFQKLKECDTLRAWPPQKDGMGKFIVALSATL